MPKNQKPRSKNLTMPTPPTLPTLFRSLALASLILPVSAGAQAVLSLPEIIITSFRGRITTGKTDTGSTFTVLPEPAAGQPFQPAHLSPGTRLDVGYTSASHAVVSLPGVGGCVLSSGASLRLPVAGENGMTITFDRHISGTPTLFLSINAAEMAKKGGAVFRFKNKFKSNSGEGVPTANVVCTTLGGRFFMTDSQGLQLKEGEPSVGACTVGVFEGSLTVEEVSAGKKLELKPGQVLTIQPGDLGPPRKPTKQEEAYDLGCKLAALGREVPARLPTTMKTTAPTNLPGTKVNSLGMVFLPVPGTKIHMCVHETRFQDFAPYIAATPPAHPKRLRYDVRALWGWEDHPVMTNWDEASAFCVWLSQKEGKKYRLPTDEEWSQAVGIGTKEKRGKDSNPEELNRAVAEIYPWGTDWPLPAGAGNYADLSYLKHHLIWHQPDQENYDDGFADTAPVMSYKPNKLGLYDMGGNVAEWCEDWYNSKRDVRVTRGGNYYFNGRYMLRAGARQGRRPEDLSGIGFRVVLEQP